MHRAGRRQLRLHLVGVVVGETSDREHRFAQGNPPAVGKEQRSDPHAGGDLGHDIALTDA